MDRISTSNSSDWDGLLQKASKARYFAYAPYSNFPVGAAIRSEDGTVFAGCNIENSSYGLTICAERVALFKAVSDGSTKFDAIALVTDTKAPVTPCGACRQVLAEFNSEMIVISETVNGKQAVWKLSELLPKPFVKNLC
jgi:cytidine deaminase